jgi:hypothetical protein
VYEANRRTPAASGRTRDYRVLQVRVSGQSGPAPSAVLCGVLALYFLVEAFAPFSIFRLCLAGAAGFLTFRLALRTRLVAGTEGITWCSAVRTSGWRYGVIDHFEVANRSDSLQASTKRALRAHLVGGRAQWLRGFESQPGSPLIRHSPDGDQWTLEELAGELNQLLADRRRRTLALNASKAS